jgi:hypothetical protein
MAISGSIRPEAQHGTRPHTATVSLPFVTTKFRAPQMQLPQVPNPRTPEPRASAPDLRGVAAAPPATRGCPPPHGQGSYRGGLAALATTFDRQPR